MVKRDDEERALARAAVGASVLGPAGAALGLSALLGEGPPRPHDPAPIGSDPWLERELRAALKKAALTAELDVKDAIVTVRAPRSAPLEQALASVPGTKTIRWA